MTPNELLSQVAANIRPVLYLDAAQTEALLRKALADYGSRVAPAAEFVVEAPDVSTEPAKADLPAEFGGVDYALDARKRARIVSIDSDAMTLSVEDDDFMGRCGPYVVRYFIDMENVDSETGSLPEGSVSVLHAYLDALIRAHNTERARSVAQATGRPDELPAASELAAEVQRIAEEMSERGAISFPVMAGGGLFY